MRLKVKSMQNDAPKVSIDELISEQEKAIRSLLSRKVDKEKVKELWNQRNVPARYPVVRYNYYKVADYFEQLLLSDQSWYDEIEPKLPVDGTATEYEKALQTAFADLIDVITEESYQENYRFFKKYPIQDAPEFSDAAPRPVMAAQGKFARQFKVGDRVRFRHSGGRLSQEVAVITGYDEDGLYTYRWEDGEEGHGASDYDFSKVERPAVAQANVEVIIYEEIEALFNEAAKTCKGEYATFINEEYNVFTDEGAKRFINELAEEKGFTASDELIKSARIFVALFDHERKGAK